jgi:cell pole-organizing protein PopZ
MGDNRQDPSMEEILASIKRVIAEEGEATAPVPRRGRQRASEEEVLELSDPVSDENSLLSPDAAEASRNRLAELAAVRRETGPVSDAPLEALVREMLKPLLKEWLDQRLPEMVEELVAREIARITAKPL